MRGGRGQKTYAVFENKRTKNNEIKEETQKEQEQEEETRWEKAWTQEEWDAKIKKREEEIELEEKTRQERMSKQRRLERSWDLLKLCREMMREEGYNWKISRERREEERRKQEEKAERLQRAAKQKEKFDERMEVKKKQQKITETLGKLPINRRILLERDLEKERRLDLKEAKEEIWKRWRLTKGRRKTNPHKNIDRSSLENKLEKVERYEAELMRIKVEKQKKDTRLEKKRKMEGHWEMLRWIVTFMGENETKWKEMKMEKERERRKKEAEEQWLLKNREERIRELAEIEEQQKAEAKNNKEARYREAVRLKRSWREWRVGEDGEEDDCVEVEEDLPLGKTEELCLICVVMPCVCPLVKLERRLELLRLKEKIRDLEEKKQKADEKVDEHDKTKQIKKNRAEHQLQDKILTKNKTTEIFPNNRADQSALHPPSPPQHPRSPSEDTSQLHHQQYQEHLSQSPITSQTSLSPPLYQYPPTSLEEPENLISKEKHPPIHLGPPPLLLLPLVLKNLPISPMYNLNPLSPSLSLHLHQNPGFSLSLPIN